MASCRARQLCDARKIVVKLGSHVVTDETTHKFNDELFNWLCEDVLWLMDQGVEVAIVSSGAVAAGMNRLGMSEPPATIPEKQAVAAVGQTDLMAHYGKVFASHGLVVGQVLITRDDFKNRRRYQNAKNTIDALFKKRVVPVINENDTVVVDEIKFGDNDNLSALVSNLIETDCLIILSDVDGLYDGDPKVNPLAKLIDVVEDVDALGPDIVGTSKTKVGTGGMGTKLEAAKRAVHAGVTAMIGSGKRPHMLRRMITGEEVGTLFPALEDRMTRRKHWIAYTVKSTGTITVDDGAVVALVAKGKSLLPKGIVSVEGSFDRGDAVQIHNLKGLRIGKGLTNYNSFEVRSIVGLASGEIVDKLGYKYYDEVIHRDDMVIDKP